MKKAKTQKNIFSILSVILSVVFVFITGATYCVSSLNLIYGSQETSTTAYLGNQQYQIINDTTNNPIAFGEGSHNFEIAMQYSISYNFDVKLQYTMNWSEGITTNGTTSTKATNVILNFANRDNIVYDENYIYLANSVTKGSGKITFITGVDYVDPEDSRYYGQTLEIEIIDVEIYKQQPEYSSSHIFYDPSSLASQTWLNIKQSSLTTSTNVLMYNYRRNYEYGISYVGSRTAYKKTTAKATDDTITTTGATWLGGNKAYAGTGMYVVTGSKPIELTIQVEGVWYADETNIDSSDLISENCVNYNYSNGWSHVSWYDEKMYEKVSFDYVINSNSACYIDILDSIEITSANRTNVEFDKYRLVISEITVNAGDADSVFAYDSINGTDFIKKDTLSVNEEIETNTSTKYYSQGLVEIVNSTRYLNGLYSTANVASEQDFNTNISLINNTADTLNVSLEYSLNYYIWNGARIFSDKVGSSTDKKRAEEYLLDGTFANDTAAFASNLTYGYSVLAEAGRLTSSLPASVTIAPYSSVTLADSYSVGSNLQGDVSTTDGNVTSSYDVWTYLKVSVAKDEDNNDMITTVANPSTANLTIETSTASGSATLSVKNNTNKIVSGFKISSFYIAEMTNEVYTPLEYKPTDWVASYWKYYEEKDGKKVPLEYDPLAEKKDDDFPSGTYYQKSQYYTAGDLTITLTDGFSKSSDEITTTNKINPGDSIVFATVTTTETSNLIVRGIATATSLTQPTGVLLINAGTENAYLINYSAEESYYVRFNGTLKDKDDEFRNESLKNNLNNFITGDATEEVEIAEGVTEEVTLTHNYFIGIIRPYQIIAVPMKTEEFLTEEEVKDFEYRVNTIKATGNYSETTISKWNSDYIKQMSKLFALIKQS